MCGTSSRPYSSETAHKPALHGTSLRKGSIVHLTSCTRSPRKLCQSMGWCGLALGKKVRMRIATVGRGRMVCRVRRLRKPYHRVAVQESRWCGGPRSSRSPRVLLQWPQSTFTPARSWGSRTPHPRPAGGGHSRSGCATKAQHQKAWISIKEPDRQCAGQMPGIAPVPRSPRPGLIA